MSSGSRATGAGTSRVMITSGSAASGAILRPIVSGCRATGIRLTGVTSGFPEHGFPSARTRVKARVRLKASRLIFPSRRRRASKPARPRRNPIRMSPGRPAYWSWQGTDYAWRPGYWAAVQPNWIWMPAHYVWTPSGYLFVAGYWDLPVANRGLMFAPVYYPQPVYAQPRLRLHAVDQHCRLGRDRQPVRLGGHEPVPLRRLLRSELRQRRDHSLVFVQLFDGSAGSFSTHCFRITP